MAALQQAQQAYDNRQPPEQELPVLTGTIELHPDRDNTLEIPARIEFLAGELHKIWIASCTSGAWHSLPLEMGDCIGESCCYVPEAYDRLVSNLADDAP